MLCLCLRRSWLWNTVFFVKELDELTQLKQEYDNYLLLFKRMILQEENQEAEKDDNENVEKKKNE